MGLLKRILEAPVKESTTPKRDRRRLLSIRARSSHYQNWHDHPEKQWVSMDEVEAGMVPIQQWARVLDSLSESDSQVTRSLARCILFVRHENGERYFRRQFSEDAKLADVEVLKDRCSELERRLAALEAGSGGRGAEGEAGSGERPVNGQPDGLAGQGDGR